MNKKTKLFILIFIFYQANLFAYSESIYLISSDKNVHKVPLDLALSIDALKEAYEKGKKKKTINTRIPDKILINLIKISQLIFENKNMDLKSLYELIQNKVLNNLPDAQLLELYNTAEHLKINLIMNAISYAKKLNEPYSITDVLKTGKKLEAKKDVWGKTNLDLSNLKISSLKGLENIPNIQNVENINLKSNLLTSIGNNFNDLKKLRTLGLADNKISTLNDVKHLTQLTTLGLSNNNISDLGNNLDHLTNLYELSLSNNNISELPTSLLDYPHLLRLYVKGNPLSENSLKLLDKLKDLNPHITIF